MNDWQISKKMKDNSGWLMIICWIKEILDSRKFDILKFFLIRMINWQMLLLLKNFLILTTISSDMVFRDKIIS